jgi:uncharacterized protein YydD (DUF2326 family)
VIHGVSSSRDTFKQIQFRPGLNVVLAEKTKDSGEKDSRNGVGKTTLLTIIDFCLGATVKGGEVFLGPEFAGDSFTLDFTLRGAPVAATRKAALSSDVTVEWREKPKQDLFLVDDCESMEFRVRDWCRELGSAMFGLPRDTETKADHPTFRALISYFMRMGDGAYLSPFKTHPGMKAHTEQIVNAFLLGLEWTHAVEWHRLRERKEDLESIRRAARRGMVKQMLGTIGELKTHRVQLHEIRDQQAADLKTFKVHPQYEKIEVDANELTEQIHKLANADVADRQLISLYQRSLAEEQQPASERIAKLYSEAGVAFPELVQRRLEEVEAFHKIVVENRRMFLSEELERLSTSAEGQRRKIEELSNRRAKLMQILETHRALDEYTKLQGLLSETEARLEDIDRRIRMLMEFDEGSSELAMQLNLLQKKARADLSERDSQYQKAVSLFNANSHALYDAPGDLVIDVGPNGFKFKYALARSKSHGVSKMAVFCYDLMLAQLWSEREQSPGFLIHDSTIFDGVDERQVAHALELAARESQRCGFQYICTMNSDAVPWRAFSKHFDFRKHVRLELTDKDEAGCLMGKRF